LRHVAWGVEHDGMRVTFIRFPENRRAWSLIERDDGVAYRMDGGSVADRLPHDLVHFTVERALGMADGIWGAIAGGAVFDSMHHEAGRRAPHAAERSAALIRAYGEHLHRAELIAGLVDRVAALSAPTPPAIARLAADSLQWLDGVVDLVQIESAAAAVRDAAGQWRDVPVDGRVTLHWPARLRMPAVPARPASRHGGPTRARRGRVSARRTG
jgi:hypothetical protein